jgi:hypothetical protein
VIRGEEEEIKEWDEESWRGAEKRGMKTAMEERKRNRGV